MFEQLLMQLPNIIRIVYLFVLYIINTKYLFEYNANDLEIIRAMYDIAYDIILDIQ